MSFFAGWVDCDIKNNALRFVCDHMATSVPGDKTMQLLDFVNCIADKNTLIKDKDRKSVV